MADAADSKSAGNRIPCGFKSLLRHTRGFMCGIVGYIGEKSADLVILVGLEKLALTRDHTERIFDAFSIKYHRIDNRIEVLPDQTIAGIELSVPNDISSAGFFMSLAVLADNTELIIKDLGINPTRTGIIDILQRAGVRIEITNKRMWGNEPVADIRLSGSDLTSFLIDNTMIPRIIDEIPVLAVVATLAKGKTIIKDARELRVKETDRISAIVKELKKMGADITETEDGFIVEGPTVLQGAECESYNDHRIAMALAIAGLIARGKTVIRNAECINISFPDFVNLAKEVCGEDSIAPEL